MAKQPRWKRKPLNRKRPKKYVVGVDMARPGSSDYSARVIGSTDGQGNITLHKVQRAEISVDGMHWVDITEHIKNVKWGAP